MKYTVSMFSLSFEDSTLLTVKYFHDVLWWLHWITKHELKWFPVYATPYDSSVAFQGKLQKTLLYKILSSECLIICIIKNLFISFSVVCVSLQKMSPNRKRQEFQVLLVKFVRQTKHDEKGLSFISYRNVFILTVNLSFLSATLSWKVNGLYVVFFPHLFIEITF